MKTIVVASRKGGSGKTTTVRHLAVMFKQAGKRVLLVDTDSQGTLTGWMNRRSKVAKLDDLEILQVKHSELAEAKTLATKAGFDILLIDTPPESNDAIVDTAKLADFVLIPAKPTPDDIDAVPRTHRLISGLEIPCAFMLNEAKPNTQILTLALETLSQLGNLAPTQYSHVAVPTAMVTGLTVLESTPSHKVVSDLSRLYEYVCEKIGE